ncbi:hypothetical protein [Corynebacterium phoceense]|uniref:hypothetical protein n=1 Tax=Corynebacterium phoceense TaxID=1686286 RepID=UPI0018A9C91A|nr:hypothetical protein [Corynebacterium phoceense]MBF9012199.1 hypothetical protein [Corynebacterium phoceense]
MNILKRVRDNARPTPPSFGRFQHFEQLEVVLLRDLAELKCYVNKALKEEFLSIFVNDDAVWFAAEKNADPEYVEEMTHDAMMEWATADPVVDLNALRK